MAEALENGCRKIRYASPQEAWAALRSLHHRNRTTSRKRRKPDGYAYQCDTCDGKPWHISGNGERERIGGGIG